MKKIRKYRNTFSILLIVQIFLAITVMSLGDSKWMIIVGVCLTILPLVLLGVFWKFLHNSEKTRNIEKLENRINEITKLNTNMTIEQTKDVLIKRSYKVVNSPTNSLMIFKRKKTCITLDLSSDLKNSLEFAYDYYNKSKFDLKIIEFIPIIFISKVDDIDIILLNDYYKKEQANQIENDNFIEYISEDGSSFSNVSVFLPMVCSANKIYFINNVQSNEILKILGV